MLTISKAYINGFSKMLENRYIVQVKICEFSQIKTTLSYSITKVKTSINVSTLNILIIENTQSSIKYVLAKFQSVKSVSFC